MESFAFSCHLGKYLVKISLGNFCFKNQNKRVFGYCSDRQNCTSGFAIWKLKIEEIVLFLRMIFLVAIVCIIGKQRR